MRAFNLKFILVLCLIHVPLAATAQSCPDGSEPAYWVAPMDPNYRRDAPGKSPMGMDLVPECGDQGEAIVSIDPQIVQNLGVMTEKVRMGQLSKSIPLLGEIQRDPSRSWQVHAFTQGWIRSLGVSGEGDPVEPGQVLYTLYSREFYAAEAELLASISSKTLRQAAISRLNALGYNDEQIKAVKRRGHPSDELPIRAERGGYVTELMIQAGQYVTPGSRLMQISDDQQLWFMAAVEESRISQLRTGQMADITIDAAGQQSWPTLLARIGTQLQLPSRTLSARFVIDNDELVLRPGMLGRATLSVVAEKEQLLAPASAIVRDGRSTRVIRALGDGQFEAVFVELGRYADGDWEVLEGLQAGDEIVVRGQFLIDSEANVDAEARRLSPPESPRMDMPMSDEHPLTQAVIKNQNKQKRWLTLAHEYIYGIDMPAMTMSFDVAEEIDMAPLQIGQTIYIAVENPEAGVFVISKIQDQP